jgi:hypothetical protein
MAKLIDKVLTPDLEGRLCGRFVEELADQVILIHTVDSDGWPHLAVLSYFEVVAIDRGNIRLATYKTSRTSDNMRQREKVTLSIFDERTTYYLKGTAQELRQEMHSTPHSSMFNVSLAQVFTDYADPVLEPGAYISSGITCVNPHVRSEQARYEATLKELSE